MPLDATLKNGLLAQLFPEDGGLTAYAVLDGAINSTLMKAFETFAPERECLWLGELEPAMQAVAPYLVRLEPERDAAFLDYLMGEGYGLRWGIYLHTCAPLKALRRHFRHLTFVTASNGEQKYFRYYDPSVLAMVIGTASDEQLRVLFGPVEAYLCELPEAAWKGSEDKRFRQFRLGPARTA
jgi:hypothetical protein